jgi:hypothetical protein
MDMTASANSPLIRVLLYTGIVVVMALAFVVVTPLMLIAGLLLLLVAGVVEIRAWFARAQQPNGALDNRRNVRVRPPDSTSESSDIS